MAETTPEVKDSILLSTKQILGVDPTEDAYDLDIITHINTAFATLHQAGVGPESGYFIEDANDLWNAFIQGKIRINSVKTYVHLSVKLIFDPPANSFVVAPIEKKLEELIWRLNAADDPAYDATTEVT